MAWSRESGEAAVRASMAQAWSEMILTIMGDGTAVAGTDSDMVVSLVENYGSMQCSVMGERGTEMESRELMAGMDRNLGMGAGLERMVTRSRGKAQWKIQLFAIRTGFMTRAGT
jgi:aminopeptidase C